MKRIGIISDTHSYLDDKVFQYFMECDEIWHAGDIGNIAVADQLRAFKPLKAVYGNIDGPEIRQLYPEDLVFTCEGLKIWMTHIGGVPPKYNPRVRPLIPKTQPDIFICGHSHILRVMHDPINKKTLYINPGAAGRAGFHHIRTLVRLQIHETQLSNVQVIELGSRTQKTGL